jgi:hypothetical protein
MGEGLSTDQHEVNRSPDDLISGGEAEVFGRSIDGKIANPSDIESYHHPAGEGVVTVAESHYRLYNAMSVTDVACLIRGDVRTLEVVKRTPSAEDSTRDVVIEQVYEVGSADGPYTERSEYQEDKETHRAIPPSGGGQENVLDPREIDAATDLSHSFGEHDFQVRHLSEATAVLDQLLPQNLVTPAGSN